MSASGLRWADAETALAWLTLRDLAPQLAALVHCPVPDKQLHLVLDWVDQLALPNAEPALGLDRLREVLPAIATCFVGAHTYAVRPASLGRNEALELFDPDGCGRIVLRVLPLTSILAAELHGEDGTRLVADVYAHIRAMLLRVHDRIASR
jgi:hypothetical protein